MTAATVMSVGVRVGVVTVTLLCLHILRAFTVSYYPFCFIFNERKSPLPCYRRQSLSHTIIIIIITRI
jgi:hypothetical protein